MAMSKDDFESLFARALYDDNGIGITEVLWDAFGGERPFRMRFAASALQGILAHRGPAKDVVDRVADVRAAIEYAYLADKEWVRWEQAEKAEDERERVEARRLRHENERKALFGE